jgi:D-tyrosyl-tRNA(Tyr) deacylase
MIALIQRVEAAHVNVGGNSIGEIGKGLLAFIAVERKDSEQDANSLLKRVCEYRVFPDQAGKMNLSITDIHGGILLVPQFTLAADTRKGTRASFSRAADPERGRILFEYLVRQASNSYRNVASGQFGADMQVTLTNDGPVTFLLRTRRES